MMARTVRRLGRCTLLSKLIRCPSPMGRQRVCGESARESVQARGDRHPCIARSLLTAAPAPQEDGEDRKLSVFHLFSEVFPEYANDKERGTASGASGLALSGCVPGLRYSLRAAGGGAGELRARARVWLEMP